MAVKKARKGMAKRALVARLKKAKPVRKQVKKPVKRLGPSTIFKSTGSLYAWKKLSNRSAEEFLCKLLIPAKARRYKFPHEGAKCRAEYAKVVGIWELKYNYDTNERLAGKPVKTGYSTYDPAFKYTVGKIVIPDGFNEDRKDQCSDGIHFFMRKKDALEYFG